MTNEATDDRRLTRKGSATRERILRAATDLIAAHGVAGTSTDDVRRAAGVSGSQLYHYFDDRQALIRAVIVRQAHEPPVPGQPPVGRLDSFDALQAWADAAVERQGVDGAWCGCTLPVLAGELASDEDSRQPLSAGFLRWHALLLDGLTAMRDRGDLREEADLDELALALLTALQGGVGLGQTLRSDRPLRAALTATLAHVRSYATGPDAADRP